MHHNPAKNVLWIAREPAGNAEQLGLTNPRYVATIETAKAKMLAARLPRPTPFVDKTMYVAWNAMFVSAYLDALVSLDGLDRRKFAPLCAEVARPHAQRSLE